MSIDKLAEKILNSKLFYFFFLRDCNFFLEVKRHKAPSVPKREEIAKKLNVSCGESSANAESSSSGNKEIVCGVSEAGVE